MFRVRGEAPGRATITCGFHNPVFRANARYLLIKLGAARIFALGNYSDRVIDKRWLRKLLVENYPITPS